MNQVPPYQNPIPPTNNRLKGLIIAAQIFSVFAILGILITFSWTVRKVSTRNKDREQTVVEDPVAPPMIDTAMTEPDVVTNSFDDDVLMSQIELQRNINASTYLTIETNTPDSTSNKTLRIAVLDVIKIKSTTTAYYIENLYEGFKDSLNLIGGSDANYTTERYFADSGRDRELHDKLLAYRTEVLNYLDELQMGNMEDLKQSLPIDMTNYSPYVESWDWGKFSAQPDAALNYLRKLELEIRNFEAAALNKFPQTVPTY
jgi:hypothetical protein